jgi:hypothetical protein
MELFALGLISVSLSSDSVSLSSAPVSILAVSIAVVRDSECVEQKGRKEVWKVRKDKHR